MTVKKAKSNPRRPNVEFYLKEWSLHPDTKVFKKFDTRSVTPYLYGPYSGTPYGKTNQLTTKNAKGWVSPIVRGELSMCARGYHAFLSHHATSWCHIDSCVYQIKPIGKIYSSPGSNKILMRRFKILRRLTKQQVANLLLYSTTTKPRG